MKTLPLSMIDALRLLQAGLPASAEQVLAEAVSTRLMELFAAGQIRLPEETGVTETGMSWSQFAVQGGQNPWEYETLFLPRRGWRPEAQGLAVTLPTEPQVTVSVADQPVLSEPVSAVSERVQALSEDTLSETAENPPADPVASDDEKKGADSAPFTQRVNLSDDSESLPILLGPVPTAPPSEPSQTPTGDRRLGESQRPSIKGPAKPIDRAKFIAAARELMEAEGLTNLTQLARQLGIPDKSVGVVHSLMYGSSEISQTIYADQLVRHLGPELLVTSPTR